MSRISFGKTTNMKKIPLLVLASIGIFWAQAQQAKGRISYERKMNMHRPIPPEDEAMKAMIPEFMTSKAELSFSGDELLYHIIPEEADVRDEAGEGENRVVIRMDLPGNNETYKNLAKAIQVDARELGPKKYLIVDSVKTYVWRPTGESKKIGNFTCYRATAMSAEKRDLDAWYTPEIAVSGGPEGYGGLPGMILELDIDHGANHFLMVEFVAMPDLVIKAPSGGKKISRKEFDKLLEERFGGSGNGQRTIRIVQDVRE